MRRLRQPAQIVNSLLRVAIRQAFARPLLTGSLLMVLAPAGQALTLGDINVRSALGQRLDARVPVILGAGEALASTCVVPSHQASDLRSIPGAGVKTPLATREGVYELRITSASALYEPMYELELKVQCPGSPALIRQYVLMLDLPGAVASSAATAPEPALLPAPAASAQSAPARIADSVIQQDPRRHLAATKQPGEPIATGARYRVVAGDSLSSIAARVDSRKVSLWALASAIQAANPDAFIRGDANLIKLGSEILIPAATTTAAPAGAAKAAPEPLPSPVAAPIPAPESGPVAPPVLATETPAPAELTPVKQPEATAEEAARPQSRPTPVVRRAAAPKPPARTVEDAAADAPNPVVAAGAGILFGLCISAILWFRGRLPLLQRSAGKPAPRREGPAVPATAVPPAVPVPVPLVTRSIEPAFQVSYTPPAEDTIETDFAGEDITSELEDLFASTSTTIQKRLNAEKAMAAGSRSADSLDKHAPEVAKPGGALDFPVRDPKEEEATSQAASVDVRPFGTPSARDQEQAQTLLESLTLLERDYEEELTASQVLDMSAVRAALEEDPDEPSQISDSHIRAASAGKKPR